MIGARRFIAGFLCGALVTAGGAAIAAKIVGSNGYMSGWTVTSDGDEICSDPYVRTSTREIECD